MTFLLKDPCESRGFLLHFAVLSYRRSMGGPVVSKLTKLLKAPRFLRGFPEKTRKITVFSGFPVFMGFVVLSQSGGLVKGPGN